MIKSKQLYKQTFFNLPHITQIHYKPFNKEKINKNQQQFNIQVDNIQLKQISKLEYNAQFQMIIGNQNFFPFFIDLSNQYLVICLKQSFLVCKVHIFDQEESIKQNGQNSAILNDKNKLMLYDKVKLAQTPTCIKISKHFLYLGTNSGKILCYDIVRKNVLITTEEFAFPLMHLQAISQFQIIGIDSFGNLKLIQFSPKIILDKIVKTQVSTKQISIVFKAKKRQKLKKMFKSFISKKDQEENEQKIIFQNQKQINYQQGINESLTKFTYPGPHLKDLFIQDQKLIAIFRRNKIQILTLSVKFQLISQKDILQIRKQQEVGMLQFGRGTFQKSNQTHLLLVVSVNDQINYFKGIEVESNYEWVQISNTKLQNKILDGKFVSNNLIILVTQNTIQICNVNQKPSKLHTFLFNKFQYIDFFIKQQKLNFNKNLIQKNILRIFVQKGQFYCLQGKRILTGKIDSWKKYLQRYVDQQKFHQAMIIALKIYNREIKKLCLINQKQEIRNKEMKLFFQKITLTFISYQIKKQKYDKQKMIQICLFFLIKTKSQYYLFTTIYQAIQALGLFNQFIQKIDKYIIQGQIQVMSEQMLMKIIQKYKKQDKKDKLQILIKNFNLSLMQKSYLLIICLKEQLYESMIHICNEHNDFISPILKLFGIYYSSINKSFQQKQRIKQIIFFYLKECLKGNQTVYGDQKSYIEMLIQLINFLFIPNTLDMLVKISCEDTMKIVNMFFQTKIFQYILQNQGKFFIKKNDYIQFKIFQENCINQFKVYEKMLSTLIYLMDQFLSENDKQNNVEQNLGDKQKLILQIKQFLCYLILKNQFPFLVKYKIDCIQFYIKNAQKIFINQTDRKQNKQSKLNSNLMRLIDSLMRSLQLKPEQMDKQLQKILKNITLSDNSEKFIESKCYILHEQGKYSQVFQLFLKIQQKNQKNRIFDYLYHNIQTYSQISQSFIKNLHILMSTNKNQTLSILNLIKKQYFDYEKVARSLSFYPQVQLEFIQNLLSKNKSRIIELKTAQQKKLSLMHLQNIVKTKLNYLTEYIQKFQYPLEQAYKICEQIGNKTARAYILIKTGRNIDGINILCQIFNEKCDNLFYYLVKHKKINQKIIEKLFDQLNKIIDTCYKQSLIDNQRGQVLWQKCLQQIFRHLRISQNMKNQSIPKKIKQIIGEIVSKLLTKMFQQLGSEFFINKFCKKFKHLPFSVFMIAFIQLFERMQFNHRLQFLEKELLQIDQIKVYVQILKKSYKAFPIRLKCFECQQIIQVSSNSLLKVISFQCGHIYHKDCMKNQINSSIKKVLKQGTCSKCMNQIQSHIQCNGKFVEYYSLNIQNKKQVQMKNKIVKLEDYQSNQGIIWHLPLIYQ